MSRLARESTQIESFAAGATSRTSNRPSGAVGCYVTAANDFTVQIDATGDTAAFTGGNWTMFLPMEEADSVVVANASDTGAVSVIWVLDEDYSG